MRFSSLAQWLSWQEGLHGQVIDLGLARVHEVLTRLALNRSAHRVITVGGTNGKGSCVAMLDAVYRASGYRVGCYTSPHLLRYNERIRINGLEVGDEALMAAFARVDDARGEVSLTYFEFGTLAALVLFDEADLHVTVLEVGLGGRLDAVNAVDADVAVITSIGLDHCDWLGSDLESIGREKAGIARAGRPLVCAEPHPPRSIGETADSIGAEVYLLGRDFGYDAVDRQWRWWSRQQARHALPLPALRGSHQLRNGAAALMAVELLSPALPVAVADVRTGLGDVTLPGRFQVLPGRVPVILDVAHNAQSAAVLAHNLAANAIPGRTLAIVAMLADKDLTGTVEPLLGEIDQWFVTSVTAPRAVGAAAMADVLAGLGRSAHGHASVAAALEVAYREAGEHDRILVFGSFYTVADALRAYNARNPQ